MPSEILEAANDAFGDTSAGAPLCPGCIAGYLHPFRVVINLRQPGSADGCFGATSLFGWVAVCQGNERQVKRRQKLYAEAGQTPPDDKQVVGPCGFSMPMTGQ